MDMIRPGAAGRIGASAMAHIAHELHVDPRAGTARLTVRNVSDKPVELNYRDGQAFDATVSQGGRVVWRWSDGQMFTMALWSQTLAAGEAVSHEFRLPNLAEGTYVLQAQSKAMGPMAPAAAAEFQVPDAGPS